MLSEEDSNDSDNTVDDTEEQQQPQHKKRKLVNNEDKWKDVEYFIPTIHDFENVPSGPTKGNAASTELECFQMFFTEVIVKEIAEQTNLYFQYILFQNICTDESLMLFKGRLFFKQYIPSKLRRHINRRNNRYCKF